MLRSGLILDTIEMILKENLDVRAVTMGIDLLDCKTGNIDSTLASVSKDSAAVFIGTNVPSSQEEAEEFFKNIDTISLDMPPMFVTYSTGDACLLA